jgi:hypothetical protein
MKSLMVLCVLAAVPVTGLAEGAAELPKMECSVNGQPVKCPEPPPQMECRVGGVVVKCPEAGPAPKAEPVNPNETELQKKYRLFMEELKPRLARTFKDPDSVQWQNVYVIKGADNNLGLCGEVNAKNSYGAYVGFKKFVAASNGEIVTDGRRKCTILGCLADDYNAMVIDRAYGSGGPCIMEVYR